MNPRYPAPNFETSLLPGPSALSWAAMPLAAATIDPSVPAVELRELVKNYGQVQALKGIDLTVRPGEIFGLLGPNGAGKTTLFSILATLRTPTAGTALVFGRNVAIERDAVRRAMGVVFQG